MKVRFVVDASQKNAQVADILLKMREQAVTEVRTKLLSGLFQGRADDLEVIGEVKGSGIEITVRDLKSQKTVAKRIAIAAAEGKRNPQREFEDEGDSPARSKVSEDDFFNKVSEDQFTQKLSEEDVSGASNPEDVKKVVSDKLAELSSEALKVFYSTKSEG